MHATNALWSVVLNIKNWNGVTDRKRSNWFDWRILFFYLIQNLCCVTSCNPSMWLGIFDPSCIFLIVIIRYCVKVTKCVAWCAIKRMTTVSLHYNNAVQMVTTLSLWWRKLRYVTPGKSTGSRRPFTRANVTSTSNISRSTRNIVKWNSESGLTTENLYEAFYNYLIDLTPTHNVPQPQFAS